MLFVLLMVACLITACVAGWPKIRRAVRAAVRRPPEPRGPGATVVPHPNTQTLEGTLTIQLIAGDITGPQYRMAMAALAARDAERHPLEVPPEATPPDAA